MSVAAQPSAQIRPAERASEARSLHWAVAAVLVAGAIAATWPVWSTIFGYAVRSEEESHSFLAVPVAAWLVWVRRDRFKDLHLAWSFAGPIVTVCGWLLAAAGFRTGVDLALHLGSLIVVLGAAYAALGPGPFVKFLPAVVALVMLLPVPGRIRLVVAGPLQEWSARIAQWALDLFGVPVLRSGNVLTINGVEVGVAEACNGMRMVSALAVIAYAFVFSMRLRPAAWIAILALSPIIALAVNVLRLVPTTLVYGYASHEAGELFHELSGWGVLALAIVLLIGITSLLRWLEIPIDARSDAPRASPALTARMKGGQFAPATAAVLIGAIFVLGGLDARRPSGVEAYHARVRAAITKTPYRIGNAVGTDQRVSPGTTRMLKPNALVQRRYADPISGAGFGLVIVHCADARDLLDHYPPVCYPANGWVHIRTEHRVFGGGPLSIPLSMYEFKRSTDRGEARTRVASFFVLPKAAGGVVDDMGTITNASRSTSAAGLGAAHVIISFAGETDDASMTATLASILEQLEPVIRTTAGGPGGE